MRLTAFAGVPLCLLIVLVVSTGAAPTNADGWIELSGSTLEAWKTPTGEWFITDTVGLDQKNPKLLAAKASAGDVMVNGANRARDIVTKQLFGDVELHADFLIAKGSNSGLKFEGLYEIQIFDSHDTKKELSGSDCGGIYPRAELTPVYHHLDKGFAPKTNACKPAGEWQTFDVIFIAPRFGADGKKTANARFVKVVLNGEVVQQDVEVPSPTGHAWTKPEIATGPLLLQGDHGPVAFRNLRVRPYKADVSK